MRKKKLMIHTPGQISRMHSTRAYAVLSRLVNRFLLINMKSTHTCVSRMSCGRCLWFSAKRCRTNKTRVQQRQYHYNKFVSFLHWKLLHFLPHLFPLLITCIVITAKAIRTCLLIIGGLDRLFNTKETVKTTRTMHATWQILTFIIFFIFFGTDCT